MTSFNSPIRTFANFTLAALVTAAMAAPVLGLAARIVG